MGANILVMRFADADGEEVRVEFTVEPGKGCINWSGRDVDWKDSLGFRGKDDVESPYGQWTRLEVLAQGDRLT